MAKKPNNNEPQAHVLADGIFSVGGSKHGWELRAKVKGHGVAIGMIGQSFAVLPHKAARALAHHILARSPSTKR